jgi:hypothetical protein
MLPTAKLYGTNGDILKFTAHFANMHGSEVASVAVETLSSISNAVHAHLSQ